MPQIYRFFIKACRFLIEKRHFYLFARELRSVLSIKSANYDLS